MAKFALLLHQDPNIHMDDSPQDIQNIVQEYVAWRTKVAEDGKMIGGAKLGDDGGRLITGHGAQLRVVDGPYSEAKEVMGGYFLIEATDYDEATTVASGCPHLQYGRIELRQLDPHVED